MIHFLIVYFTLITRALRVRIESSYQIII